MTNDQQGMSAITVDNVSKRYRKGQRGYRTLREDLYSLTGRLFDIGAEKKRDADAQHMWALRDVSFEVKPGERVGIIGRNGSGKTTLLRLLAGVTRPTRGRVTVRGRLGVLIEIMAGFHPELTGRENVYLNGAIMGMSRAEIKRKFDEIVTFAEVEDWIDTPIKRYSSGMHVRLGFAVAAHLDPDILLIDEVLAVGDAAFQQKCLGKMETAAQEGRTVVFVSHNMTSVKALCEKAMVLDGGCVLGVHPSAEAIELYLARMSDRQERTDLRDRDDRRGSGEARVVDAWLARGDGRRLGHSVPMDSGALSFNAAVESDRALEASGMAIGVYDSASQCMFWLDSRALLSQFPLKPGVNLVSCRLSPGFTLARGRYSVNIAVFGRTGLIDHVPWAMSFEVVEGDFYGTGRESGGKPVVYIQQSWEVR